MLENTWNTSLYDTKHAFVSEYGKGLLPLLEPKKGETILDIGCGSGLLAHSIAQAGAHVVGIDSSESMIAAAQTSYPGIEFLVADASSFTFPYTFDAIFSNATLHWVREAEQTVQHIAAALKPGGRFVAEFGGKGNVAAITTSVQQAMEQVAQRQVDFGWYFPSIGEYTPLLERYGLSVQLAQLFDRPTKLEEGEQGLKNWLQMFGGRVFTSVSEPQRERVLQEVEQNTRPRLFRDGSWYADYRRLRIVAYKN